jgi:hypothetical protein
MAVTIEVKDGSTLTVAGPATAVVTSDVPGSCLIDGQPIPGGAPGEAPAPEEDAPTISSLSPAFAVIGDPADLEMIVTGTGFTDASTIVFNGGDETTAFISDVEVSTTVKPSTAGVAGAFPVEVRNGELVSNSLPFTFTEPAAGTRSKPRR